MLLKLIDLLGRSTTIIESKVFHFIMLIIVAGCSLWFAYWSNTQYQEANERMIFHQERSTERMIKAIEDCHEDKENIYKEMFRQFQKVGT